MPKVRWHCPKCGEVALRPTRSGYAAMRILNRIPALPCFKARHKECGEVISSEDLILKINGEAK